MRRQDAGGTKTAQPRKKEEPEGKSAGRMPVHCVQGEPALQRQKPSSRGSLGLQESGVDGGENFGVDCGRSAEGAGF